MAVDLSTLSIPDAHPLEHDGGRCELVFPGQKRIIVPKGRRELIAWRKDLLHKAETSRNFRATLLSLYSEPCPEAIILWFNSVVWLFKQQQVGADGHQRGVKGRATNIPGNSWPVQDWAIGEIFEAMFEGHDLVVDKSRQMGVTVLITAIFLWFALYQPASVMLCMSEKEDLVDNPADPYAIFWKLDYILDRLPWWAKPTIERKRLLIANQENGSSILGRSTTADTGRGGALLAALIDEAGTIGVLESILTALADATACRIANSTPKGPNYYSDLVQENIWPKLVMPWWNHPEKGRGRELAWDDELSEVYVTSPFYRARVDRAGGRATAEIAQELDMKHTLAGASFFDQVHIIRQKTTIARPPDSTVSLHLEPGVSPLSAHEDDWIRQMAPHKKPDPTLVSHGDIGVHPKGPLSLWIDLEPDRRDVPRPPQNLTYVIGGDTGQGQGASNSIASVFCIEMAQKVGEYASATVNPHEFARALALLGIWFGGTTHLPWLNLEANGPGLTTIQQLQKLHYTRIMKRLSRGPDGLRETDKYGWISTRESKDTMLQKYRNGLNTGGFRNTSARALEEASRYVRYANGGIGPGRLEKESADARATHGDRVIGDGLAWDAALRIGPRSTPADFAPPEGSPAADEMELQELEKRGPRKRTPWRPKRARAGW